jgi:hypothetical protein
LTAGSSALDELWRDFFFFFFFLLLSSRASSASRHRFFCSSLKIFAEKKIKLWPTLFCRKSYVLIEQYFGLLVRKII